MEGLDYTQRLKMLKMYSIQRRHERYKMLYAYKIKENWFLMSLNPMDYTLYMGDRDVNANCQITLLGKD